MIDPARMVRLLRRLNTVSLHRLTQNPERLRELVEDTANMIEHLAGAVDVDGFNAGVDACIRHCQAAYEQRKSGPQELSYDKRHLQLGEQYAYHQVAKYDLPGLKIAEMCRQEEGQTT